MEDLRHTKNVLKNENYFQCFHNNVGYCKYRDHCQYQHFTEICQKTVCRDKTCKFRHPRSCKFGEHCRFLQKQCCLYRHKVLKSNSDEESGNLMLEVKKLEIEVMNLKKQVEEKQQKIKEITDTTKDQNKMIKELKEENCKLNKVSNDKDDLINELKNKIVYKDGKETELEEQKDNVNKLSEKVKDLIVRNEKLKEDNEHLLERISFKHLELERIKENFNCDTCDFKAETMSEFNVHSNSDHGEEKDITCNLCDLKFKREFDLHIHNSAKHTLKSFGFTPTKERKTFLFPNIPLK